MRCKVITGVTGDQTVSPSNLRAIRVGGAANLVAAVAVKQGATTLDTLAIGSTPGTERNYYDCQFDSNAGQLAVNMGNVADVVLVFYT